METAVTAVYSSDLHHLDYSIVPMNSDTTQRRDLMWKIQTKSEEMSGFESGILSLTKCAKEIYSIKDRAESEWLGTAPRNRQPALFIIIKSRTSSTPHKRSEKFTIISVVSVFIDSTVLSARGIVFSGTLIL